MSLMSSFWDTVSDAAESVVDEVKETASDVADTVEDAAESVADTASDAVEAVGDAATSVYHDAEEAVGDAADAVGDAAESAYDAAGDAAEAVGDAATSVYHDAEEAVGDAADAVEDAAESVYDAAGDAADAVGDAAESLYEDAEDAVGDAADAVRDAAESVYDAASDALEDAADAVRDTVEEGIETVEDAVDAVEEAVSDAADAVLGISRGMNGAEISRAQGMYQDSIDYSKVSVVLGGIGPAGAGARAIGNSVCFENQSPYDPSKSYFDPSNGNLTAHGMDVLMHELMHVWQYQHGGAAYIPSALGAQLESYIKTGSRDGAYDFGQAMRDGIPWEEWNAEQQAEAMETYSKAKERIAARKPQTGDQDVVNSLQPYLDKVLRGEGAPTINLPDVRM